MKKWGLEEQGEPDEVPSSKTEAKKLRLEEQGEPDEVLSSKTEAQHTVKRPSRYLYPRTTWDIPRPGARHEKPNFAFLKVPEWVNERDEWEDTTDHDDEREDITDEQFTRWGLDAVHQIEGLPEEPKNMLKMTVANQEIRSWKPRGEILEAHVSIQEATTPNQQANKEKIKVTLYRVSGEVTRTLTYRNHHRIEDLYMDLLPWSFVRAILDKEGKDINMEDQIKNYKQIIIEARDKIGARRLLEAIAGKRLEEVLEGVDEEET